ncbi:MAG: hypothetical protein F4082_05530 [Gammaproteobacteria bacterium]|nr:hypothetical protein [Gammaproteobacteria bacterium]
MDYTGSSVTCLPVSFDAGNWETAIFFQIGGGESKQDRRNLTRLGDGVVPVAIESDVIKHESASVVVIRLEVFTRGDDNALTGEVLLTPGETESHFETLKLLSSQPRIRWYFADAAYWIIHSQQNQLGLMEHEAFKDVLDQATQHDALIRLTGKYDVQAALTEVVSHYEFRETGWSRSVSSSEIH